MSQQYGTIISTFDSPSTRKFAFTVNKDIIVHRGQFVELDVVNGKLIGRISDIFKTNRYFMRPESVTEVAKSGRQMDWDYPVWEHEYLVAEVSALGVFKDGRFGESTFPPSPGTKVMEPDHKVLFDFFGLDPEGLHLGKLAHHDVDVKINATRLLQKHMAILAISGAGKSYLTSVLLEELLNRDPEKGQIATIIIDPHGEYSHFLEDPKFANKVKVFKASEFKIGVPNLSAHMLTKFAPDSSSGVQTRELNRIMREMDDVYGLDELTGKVETDEKIKSATKDILISLLENLKYTGLFGVADYPSLEDTARQGEVTILDLSKEINLHNKQIMTAYIAKKLFDARRNGIIPPFLLIVEEAHQFAPEKSQKQTSISKGIIETIAREGRKFHSSLCLISQRPVQLSTTALSQCNTHVILKVTNPYDLKHIGESSEGITKPVLRQISSLNVGSGLIVGEGVNFPVFINIRSRGPGTGSGKGMSLEKAAVEYYKRIAQKKKDAKGFM
ncbi:MAG: ATP-binding protein [Candidatus Aenigmarchaeota archaeon]|nr:ATP-binding protein [Candidatus Aenigmarchaeota archaeon]